GSTGSLRGIGREGGIVRGHGPGERWSRAARGVHIVPLGDCLLIPRGRTWAGRASGRGGGMLASTIRTVERRCQAAGRHSPKVAPCWAGWIGASMSGANVGIGAERTDRAVGLANTGNMAVPPAAPTLGELVAGVSELNPPGLRVEPNGSTELLNIVGGDRDNNGGGSEPLRRVRLERASSEDGDLDGSP